MKSARFVEILELLIDREVKFIVVGMTAGVLAGAQGRTVSVLQLSALIEIKRRAGRPKDLAALAVLEATLDERTRRP